MEAERNEGLAGRAGSALSCFDCAWHLDVGYLLHVTCRYPRERVPAVVDMSGCHDGVALTKDIAATVCPGFKSPNSGMNDGQSQYPLRNTPPNAEESQ